MRCDCCGQTIRTPKPKPTATANLATANLTELFAHFKRTAPQGDLRFYAEHTANDPTWRARFETLAEQLERSSQSDATRKREAWRLIDQYKAESSPWRMVNDEAGFWRNIRALEEQSKNEAA